MLQKPTNFCSIDLIDIRDNLNDISEIYNFLNSLYLIDSSLKEIYKPVIVPYYYGKV